VDEKIALIEDALSEHGSVSWLDLFRQCKSRVEMVCCFLAILELGRMRKIRVNQSRSSAIYECSPPNDPRNPMWFRRKPFGRRGEDLAARALRRAGYRILDGTSGMGRTEIDIIAREKDTVAFVEVKSRRTGEPVPPEDNVGRLKRRHIRAAARCTYRANKTEKHILPLRRGLGDYARKRQTHDHNLPRRVWPTRRMSQISGVIPKFPRSYTSPWHRSSLSPSSPIRNPQSPIRNRPAASSPP
jgi:putative endonuclease